MATHAASTPALPPVTTVAQTGSTQTDLLALVHDETAWPHLSGIRALRQVGGRGRRGRSWQTDTLEALTVSLVLRRLPSPALLPWVPVLTGAALAEVLTGLGADAGLKWPNDVLLPADEEVDGWGRWRKVAGVLAEGLPGGGGVVVGIGVNLAGDVPVPWATTLREHGIEVSAEKLLELLRVRLASLLESEPCEWPEVVGSHCRTLGMRVHADLPGGAHVVGSAVGIDAGGGLLVRADDGLEHVLVAAEIAHLRTATSPAG